MFAGVAAILLNEENNIILGIASREGEEVRYLFFLSSSDGNNLSIFQVKFLNPVSTVDHPKINEWLTLVEKEMRVTLASYLTQAVQDIKQFKGAAIDPQKYMEWCDKYQVKYKKNFIASVYKIGIYVLCLFQAQIVVLAAQILWSEDVEAALQQADGGQGIIVIKLYNQIC